MKEKILNLLKKNIIYFSSLVLSISLWFYVLSTEPAELKSKVRVDYIVGPGTTIENEIPQYVELLIKGPKAFLRGLERRPPVLTMNLTSEGRSKKTKKFTLIDHASVALPFGVSLMEIRPPSLDIKIVKAVKKRIVLEVPLMGALPENQKLMYLRVIPEKLVVSGPKSLLKNLKALSTVGMDRGQMAGKGEREISLATLDARLKMAHQGPIKVQYLVRPTKANLQLNDIKIRFLSSRPIRRTSAQTASLLVFSEKGEDIKIATNEVTILADIPENKSGRIKIKLKAILPEGIHMLKIQPDEIVVQL